MIRFGIIGAGLMGKRRAQSLLLFPDEAQLVRVMDTDLARATKLASEFGCEATEDARAILDDASIDAVIVATATGHLTAIAADAIRAGKHVLIEKPAGTDAAQIDTMLALNTSTVVRVGFNHRFLPSIQKARELVGAGRIGELLFIKATYGQKGRIGLEKEWRAGPRATGGGELLDQGVHVIDLCRLFMGDATEVRGITGTLFWKMPADDNAFFTMRDGAGVIADVHVSTSLWRNTFRFELHGSTGLIEIAGIRSHYGAPTLTLLTRNEAKSAEVGVYQFDEEKFTFDDTDTTWRDELRAFLDTIAGAREADATLEDARAALRVVDEIYRQSGL